MRVRVNEDRCQGHTLCHATAPDVFHLREEDGHTYTTHGDVPPDLEEAARRAAQGCPEQAIHVISDE